MANPPDVQDNLWLYARTYVDNKGVMTRIGHSPVFRTPRAIFKSLRKGEWTAAGSKIARSAMAGLKGTLNHIPIPFVGALTAAFVTKLERIAWQHRYASKHEKAMGAGGTADEQIKFRLKISDVGDLDNHRRKLTDAFAEHNTAASNLAAAYGQNSKTGKVCDVFVDYALTVAQFERRMSLLNTEIFNLLAIVVDVADWTDKKAVGSAVVVSQAGSKTLGEHETSLKGVVPLSDSVFGRVNANKIQIGLWIRAELDNVLDGYKPNGVGYKGMEEDHKEEKRLWEERKRRHDSIENGKFDLAEAARSAWDLKSSQLPAGARSMPPKPVAYARVSFPDTMPVFILTKGTLDEQNIQQALHGANALDQLHANCGKWCIHRACVGEDKIFAIRDNEKFKDDWAAVLKFIVSPVEPSLIMSGIKENTGYQEDLAEGKSGW
jgi:hypothetical protein